MDRFLEKLAQQIDGDVLTNTLSRMLYATDASPYQSLPLAVCRPRHSEDCVTIVKLAARSKCPIIPRAEGTSLAGQCVGNGLIVDVSHYLNRILDIDAQNRRATVQPGVVCEVLNAELRTHKLMFSRPIHIQLLHHRREGG